MLKTGIKAPNFTLKDQKGEIVNLSDYQGQKIVLYFYPKDDTPGCTIQAQTFGQYYEEFQALGIPVIGISKDTVASHKRFCSKYDLPFTLLSDTTRETLIAYDVAIKKMRYGKMVNSTSRSTYLIDEDGYIKHVWENVSPDENAVEILNFLKK